MSSLVDVDPPGLHEFVEFCSELTLEDGSPVEIAAHQRVLLREFFAGATETLVLIPKKNGKSTTLALVALHHLLVTADAECVIAAASRDQAAIMLRQAHGFIRRSEALQRVMGVKQREIVSAIDAGRIRILASDVDTADGVIPTLALIDELHRHKSADLYGVFRDGLGPRNGRLITISTAGDDELSPLGLMRQAAHRLPVIRRDGAYRFAASEDGGYVVHEWALDSGEDRHDMNVVKTANPAPWQTLEALARRHDSPSMMSWQWARFACGVWEEAEESLITAEEWDACRGDVDIPPGAEAFVGVDVGKSKDSTAVVLASWVDGKLHVRAQIRVPTQTHKVTSTDVRDDIKILERDYQLREVAFDPWRFEESAEMLAEEGVVMVQFNQNDSRMCPASESLLGLVREQRLVHDGDPLLRDQVLSAVARDTERGVRISKRKSRRRIDACVALAMAADRAVFNVKATPLVEVFG